MQRKRLRTEIYSARTGAPARVSIPRPERKYSEEFSYYRECARNLKQKVCPETWLLCLVPVDGVVQFVYRLGMKLYSQLLSRPQSQLDFAAHFAPVFQLGRSACDLAYTPMKLLHPSFRRIRVLGLVKASNQLCSQPCSLSRW